jgi:hypothetical protein
MDQRICASAQFIVDDKTVIIQNRIAAKKYTEAFLEYKKAEAKIIQFPDCPNDLRAYNLVINNHSALFNYINQKNYAEKLLSEKKYKRSVEQYLVCIYYFNLIDQNKYQLTYPSLKQFVEEKNKVELTRAAADYFVSIEDYQTAFDYLVMLKKQKVPAKLTRDLQKTIGEGLAKSKKSTNLKVDAETFTGGDGWYKYFKNAYQGFLKI